MSTSNLHSTGPQQTSLVSFSEGQKLAGCYVLVRRLVTGDQSEVWAALDEVLGKDVCLHFIPEAARNDARAMTELRQEIKRCRQLIHPNILRVYDVIEEPDWAAISTDTFEGESLAILLQNEPSGRFPAARVQPWFTQAAQTLEEAHKINILHRDLTPTNLFLTPAGKILVANFGVSRIVQDALRRAGMGDPSRIALASPQSVDGQAPAKADDIYSLGALLYHWLTGQKQAGVTPEALAVLKKPELAVPVAWQEAVVSCLQKEAGARPETIAELTRLMSAERPQEVSRTPVPSPGVAAEAAKPVPAASRPEPVAPRAETKSIEPERAAQPEPKASSPEPVKAAEEKKSPGSERPAAKRTIEFTNAGPETVKAPAVEKSEPEPPTPAPKKELEASRSFPPAPAKAPAPRKPQPEFSPKRYSEGPSFPFKGLAIAAALILIAAGAYHLAKSKNAAPEEPYVVATPPPERPEVPVINDTSAPPVDSGPSKPAGGAAAQGTPGGRPAGTEGVAMPKVETPAPGASPAPSASDKIAVEKAANLEKAREVAQAAEKAHADLLKQAQQAEASAAETRKLVEEKTKAMEPVKRVADEAVAKRKKLEEDQKAAETAAAEAQKAAAEKSRLAERAKMAAAEADKTNQELLAAQQKASAELEESKNALTEKQRMLNDATKAASEADAARLDRLAAVTKAEQEIEAVKTAAAAAQRARETDEAERRKVEQELADMKKAFADRMAELEAKRQSLSNPGAAKAPVPETHPPSAPLFPPLPQPSTPEPMKVASIPSTPFPLATPAPAESGDANSLGQKFMPVGEVAFCVWQTRVKDFEVFAKAVNLKSSSWKGPGFKQGADHPVVNVTWQEAIAFCKWLTEKEHKEGKLPANQFYRLPTDLEWSKGVGLGEEKGKTPEARDMGVPDVYPWGTSWPPPKGAGNYTGEETGSDVAIRGYDDGFAWTAPVGSFPPNKFGIYDMGGNVWQWCMDAWENDSKDKVLRGASWYNGALKLSLLSSCRVHAAPDSSTDNYGFRIVRATEVAKPSKK